MTYVGYPRTCSRYILFCLLFIAGVTADAHMKGKLVKKKGQEYIEVKDTIVKLTVKSAKAHFGNLFNGDATLSK